MKRRLVLTISALSILLFFQIESPIASVVLQMSFDEVVAEAELIIEGEVLSKEVRFSSTSIRPFTYFKIAIFDVVKGEYPDQTIEIGYMGGRIGENVLTVSEMRMPAVGEHGVYFIETLSEQQIHPLIGWQQGHYRVIIDQRTGQERVVSEHEMDVGTNSRALILQQGTDLETFKNEIRDIIEGGR